MGYKFRLIASLVLLLLVFSVTPGKAQAHDVAKENLLSLSNIGELYDDLGPMKLMLLMLTPKNQRAMYYHTVSIDASDRCKSPNAWYFEGTVEDDICQQMKEQGYNVVCNTKCPADRATGITCGLSHECCEPAKEEPAKSDPVRCEPQGAGKGIQYCTFF